MYDFSFWEVPREQKLSLSTLYGPYLAICEFPFRNVFKRSDTDMSVAAFMTVDMYLRLNDTINQALSASMGKKKAQ